MILIKKKLLIIQRCTLLSFVIIISYIQSTTAQTSWKGTISTNWATAANWTSGVPVATVDAIIGDANFTGSFQPLINGTTVACKSITIGLGSVASTLTVTKNLNVSGNIVIGSNGIVVQNAASVITLSGNWVNSGIYSATISTATVTFSGGVQTITGPTTFKNMIINSGSIVTLACNISLNTNLSITGTLDPTENYTVSGTASLTVNSGGTLRVKAANFNSNYAMSGSVILNGTSTVNYSSSINDQNISSAYNYGYLRISGGTTKYLTANLPPLISTSSSTGRIYIDAGIFDLQTYTANRNTPVAGGYVIMAGTAKLKIGGTNGFPSNFNTITLPSTCTVEYYGNNQTILAATYGNLTLSSSSGVAIKTLPASALTIAGNFTCTSGSGTGISATAGNKMTVNKTVTIDAGSAFNAGSFIHSFKGNWINNGTFNGQTSTVTFSGISSSLTGTGTNNFNNITFSASGITASGSTSINVAGNIGTTGSGIFTHGAGGTLTMTGTTKTLAGSGLKLCNFTVSGTATLNNALSISGNLIVNGTFTATTNTVSLNGNSKSISGGGTINFNALNILGTISTANNISTSSNITISLAGSFTASAGTTTIAGSGTLSGTANFYNLTINPSRTLTLGTSSVLGIAGIFTKTGTLQVTSKVPNTVQYNGTGAQNIVSTAYNNLILANGGTKTAAGAITINNDLSINIGVSFAASSYSHSIYRHFNNAGNFVASTSTISLLGASAANIYGTTTFNTLIINKSTTAVWITQLNNITVGTLTMTKGNIQTGSNSVTITNTRTGTGLIIGTITHSHAFTSGTPYYFEGAQNIITFTSPSVALNSVTVNVSIGLIPDFNAGQQCVNREYTITIPAGTYTNATLRFHYEDNELNAYNEPNLTEYKYNTGTAVWDSIGITTRDGINNYVEKTGITNAAGRWTLSGVKNVVRWNGSVSTVWENAANWTTISGVSMINRVPTFTDEAQIGQSSFTYHPTITSNRTVSVLKFGSVKEATLTIASGASLTTIGAVTGVWTANASHTLDAGSGTLNVGTNIDLSDGVNGHDILLRIGSGTVNIINNLNQKASGGINFTGNGSLSIAGDFNYTGGSFSSGLGTVIYTGGEAQVVAPVTYYNLSFTKTTERAIINFPANINGNLELSTAGEVVVNDSISIAGNVTIGSGTTLTETGVLFKIGGNWSNLGAFVIDSGTVNFNGTGNQTVDANSFNNLKITKSSGILIAAGDLLINSNLTLMSGTFELGAFLADRTNPGGTLTLGASTLLKVAGANNFPNNYINDLLDNSSTVEYNGTVGQVVTDVDYGNLTFTNGGATSKIITGDINVNGNFLINSGATLTADSSNITLFGNFTNSGNFNAGTGALILNGSSKNITGNNTFNDLEVISGSYTVTSGSTTILGNLFVDVSGSLNFGNTNVTLDGDLTNKGSLLSNGTATFTGNVTQTIQLLNAITSSSTGVINFNGTISPVLNSTSSPAFANVNINNTGGITPSTPWTVYYSFNVAAGASFDGGSLSHTFYGNFTNNGTVISSGELNFIPTFPFSSGAAIKLDGVSFTSTGKIEFGGSVPITITDNNPSFNMVFVTNTNAVGIAPPNNWIIPDQLYIGPGATFKGGTNLSHTLAGNFTNNGTLTGETSTINFTGNPVAINGLGNSSFYNIIIASGADLSLNRTISINKDFTNNGQFNAAGRIVKFSGTGVSTISGTTSPVIIDDFEQNKSASITVLNVPVNITGNIIMTNGIITTTSTNILTLVDNVIATGGSDTSYIEGPVKKAGDDPFTFPLGKGGYFHPVSISAPAFSTDEFTAKYFYANPDLLYSVYSKDLSLDHLSTCEYWTLERTNGTSDVSVSLSWDGNSCGVNSLVDLRVAQWNGTMWKDFGNGASTGTTSSGTVTSANAVTTYGPFTLGSPPGYNPLPIGLLKFTAQLAGKYVAIDWTTLSEHNNDFFTIEKSKDGELFTEIARIKGAGNSTGILNYKIIDDKPFKSTSYYRLKQTDFNGEFKYSKTEMIQILDNSDFNIFPNPTRNSKFFVTIPATKDENVHISIYDNYGKEVFSETVIIAQNGENTIAIEPSHKLLRGIYTMVVNSKQNLYKHKLMIN